MSSWARLTGGEDGPERGSFADAFKEIERRLSALERHRRGAISSDGTDTFLRSGDFVVTGGNIRVLSNGDVIIDGGELRAVSGATTRTLLDRDRLRLNRADGTRQVEITPAGGLRVYAANGTTLLTTIDGEKVQVGPDVVMDSDGLRVIGGPVVPLWFNRFLDSSQNVSLGTSFTTVGSFAISPPAWVEDLLIWFSYNAQVTDSAGGKRLIMQINRAGNTFSGLEEDLPGSPANVTFRGRSGTGTIAGTFNLEARVTAGSNSSNSFGFRAIAFGQRNT